MSPAPARVPFPTVAAFAMPGVLLAGVVVVYGVYVPRYYAGLIGSLAVVGGAIGLVRLADVFFDPVLGLAMDRTRTAIGRYRPWLILGAPLLMLGLYRVLAPKGPVDGGYLVVWMLVSYLGVSMLTLGTAAWTSVLATTYDERSRVFGWTLGLAVIGSDILLLLGKFTGGAVVLGKAASMPAIALILVVATPVAVAICVLFTPERAAVERPRYAWRDCWKAMRRPTMLRLVAADLLLSLGPGTTGPLYVFFFHDAKGFSIADVGFLLIFYIGASLIGAPIWARLARAIGKHRALQAACLAYAVAQTILMALPRVWPGYRLTDMAPTIAGMFAVGFTASAFLLLVRAMVADFVDEVRLERGQDITSLLFSLVTTTNKIGLSISTVFSFSILAMVGYNPREAAVNTPQAIFGLEMCYLFAPIILVFFGGGLFFGYRLDSRRHAEIRAQLDLRDAAAARANANSPGELSRVERA